MLRKLVLLLLLGNLVLWAWSHGALAAFGWAAPRGGEPQRLREQVHASNLVLLGTDGQPLAASAPVSATAPAKAVASPASSAQAASSPPPTSSGPAAPSSGARAGSAPAASAPAASSKAHAGAAATAASAPAAAASAAPARSASGALTQASAQATSCARIGPYTGQADPKLGAALQAAGLRAQALRQDLPEQWMVFMGPYANSTDLQRKLDELRRLSLPAGSFIQVTGRPRYEPGISLGVFDQRAQAQVQLKRLQAHGVQTAHVVQRNLGMQAQYWVLPALNADQAQRLRALPALHAADMHAQDCLAH
jgi:hypothetical protein